MEIQTQNRWTMGLIVFLVILNLIAVGTVWYKHFQPSALPHPVRNQGQGLSPDPGPRNGPMMRFLRQELGLTREQMQQIRALHEEQYRQLQAVREEMHTYREAMKDILFDPAGDPNELRVLARNIGRLQAELEWSRFHHFLQIKALCTDRQKKRFEALINDLFEQTRPPHPNGMPGHPPRFNGGPQPGPRSRHPGPSPEDF